LKQLVEVRAMQRRTLLATAAIATAALLGGCAALDTVTSEVATYGEWPAGRQPGRYVFERLPSQQVQSGRAAILEAAAARGLEAAGFAAAPDAAQADVIVQIGARISRTEISPWDDPLWWRWGGAYWRSPAWRPWRGAYYANFHADWYATRYERSVALLLRDRASGAPLYEAHAQNDGTTAGDSALLAAMFEAAMKDFPATGASNPRRVTVQRAP
jgi:hypothetical protein